MERRDFIKASCAFCAAVGVGLAGGALASCASIPVYATSVSRNKIVVPRSLFAEEAVQIIRAKELDYDIALRKEENGRYSALLLRCTHASNSLTSTDNGFICPLHGSRFDKEGGVTRGPATVALKQLAVQFSDKEITIGLE
jgi:Rieske Fe-S protein